MSQIKLVIFALAFLLPATFALKCYSCQARLKNGELTAGLNCFEENNVFLKDCSINKAYNYVSYQDYRGQVDTSVVEATCGKRVEKLDQDVELITRTCMIVPKDDKETNACKTHTVSNSVSEFGTNVQFDTRAEATTCTCNDGDGCNSATSSVASLFFIGGLAVISKLLL